MRSAFAEVADLASRQTNGSRDRLLDVLLSAFDAGEPAFQELCKEPGVNLSVDRCLKIYREHEPTLSLSPETVKVLEKLKSKGCVLGIITDGRIVTQRNKIKALGLERFVDDGDIVISEAMGSTKPYERNYLYFETRYPDESFVYVGDNPSKDFITPNRLGWTSVCLLDNGENIHKQDFLLPSAFLPRYTIHRMGELEALPSSLG